MKNSTLKPDNTYRNSITILSRSICILMALYFNCAIAKDSDLKHYTNLAVQSNPGNDGFTVSHEFKKLAFGSFIRLNRQITPVNTAGQQINTGKGEVNIFMNKGILEKNFIIANFTDLSYSHSFKLSGKLTAGAMIHTGIIQTTKSAENTMTDNQPGTSRMRTMFLSMATSSSSCTTR